MSDNIKYAGWWQRAMANSIDQIVIGIPATLILAQVFLPYIMAIPKVDESEESVVKFFIAFKEKESLIFLLFGILWALGNAFMCAGKWQASLGKRLCGIYIVKANGGKPSFANSFGRFLSPVLFWLMLQSYEKIQLYKKLDALKTSGKPITTILDLQEYITTDVTGITALATFLGMTFWYLLPVFTKQKTAAHDILFETRVICGKL